MESLIRYIPYVFLAVLMTIAGVMTILIYYRNIRRPVQITMRNCKHKNRKVYLICSDCEYKREIKIDLDWLEVFILGLPYDEELYNDYESFKYQLYNF